MFWRTVNTATLSACFCTGQPPGTDLFSSIPFISYKKGHLAPKVGEGAKTDIQPQNQHIDLAHDLANKIFCFSRRNLYKASFARPSSKLCVHTIKRWNIFISAFLPFRQFFFPLTPFCRDRGSGSCFAKR